MSTYRMETIQAKPDRIKVFSRLLPSVEKTSKVFRGRISPVLGTYANTYGMPAENVGQFASFELFPSLDIEPLCGHNEEQKDRARLFMWVFQEEAYIYMENKRISDIPRMSCSLDEDGALQFSWEHRSFLTYFSIEKRDKDSFYGIYRRDSATEDVLSFSGKLPKHKYRPIIRKVIRTVNPGM